MNKIQKFLVKSLGVKSLIEENTFHLTDNNFQSLNYTSLLGNSFKYGESKKSLFVDAYGGNPYVFSVIDRITKRAVSLEKKWVNVFDEELESVPQLDTLMRSRTFKDGWKSFEYRLYANALVGECFVVKEYIEGFTDPVALFIPTTSNVTINENVDGSIRDYTIIHYGITRTFQVEDVYHAAPIPNILLDTNYSFSPLTAGRKVWENNNLVWSSEGSLHKNKGVNGVLYSKGQRPMTPSEQTALQSDYDQKSTGQNFGKVRVANTELGFVSMGMNPNDLKSIEARLDHLRSICSLYNVDPKLFGDSAGSTYNNMPESKKGLITDAVIPLLDSVNPSFYAWLSDAFNLDITVNRIADTEKISELKSINKDLSDKILQELQSGVLTGDEAREILYPNLGPKEVEESIVLEGDNIEGNTAAEQANQEAQANLRGSVGGVQGILEIQQSVIAGATSRSSAMSILMTIYGFDEAQASEILG